MKYHYVYRIFNTVENKHYYGVRSCIISPKLDLGIKYFSSSTDKEFIKDQKINPQKYKYKVVRIYNSRKKAAVLEIKLHNKFNVGINESFYNKVKQSSTGFDRSGISPKKESIKLGIETKIKNGNLTHSEETRKKISDSMTGMISNTKNKKRSKFAIEKAANSNTGKKRTKEQCENISNSLKGRKLSEEHKNNVSTGRKGLLTGKDNPSAEIIHIFNSNDELMFECHGNFQKICNENKLPEMSLIRSYRNNGAKLYQSSASKTKAKNNGNEKFINWYAIKI